MLYCTGKLIENLKLFYKSNRPHFHSPSARDLQAFLRFSRVLPTSRVGYHAGKPIESVVYCLIAKEF